jgi:predicted nucleic acid-binding protein
MADSGKRVRVLTDANVLFAGTAFPRWPREVLRHAVAGDFQLVLCPLVIEQARRNLQKRFPEYLGRFEEVLQTIDYELISDPTSEDVKANQNLVRDLSDVAIALAAIAAGVDYVISEDKDLTVKDESTVELRRRVKVMLSGTFLREVMGWSSEELEAIRYRKWSDMPEGESHEEKK